MISMTQPNWLSKLPMIAAVKHTTESASTPFDLRSCPELSVRSKNATNGDSHTATHGAFGALAFGIGTSEVEHVLATQTLAMAKPKTMKVEVVGDVSDGVGPKDII